MEREIRNRASGIYVRFIPPDKWWHRAKWELLQSYTSDNNNVTAPVGFITDGASIPWFLRWRFSPTGKYFGAAIVHDYILITEEDWKRANKEFAEELKAVGVSAVERALMVFFVGTWGRIKSALGLKVKKL